MKDMSWILGADFQYLTNIRNENVEIKNCGKAKENEEFNFLLL